VRALLLAVALAAPARPASARELAFVGWRANGNGQSTALSHLGDVTQVAGGWNHTVALRSDGTVVAWGGNYSGQTTVPEGLTDAVAVAAGAWHSLALSAAIPTPAEPPPAVGAPLTLGPVAPNPARGTVAVRYALVSPGAVTLEVLDALGRRVALLHEGPAAAGSHEAWWEAGHAPAGVYLVRLRGAEGQAVRRVTLVR
jgi:hypothetical protein